MHAGRRAGLSALMGAAFAMAWLGYRTFAEAGAGRGSLKLPSIVVKKSARRLELYSAARLVRSYRVGLGLNPVADTTREGDRCTPEGSFYITSKLARSSFHRSLGISYPNAAEAERGLRSGLLSKAEHQQILRALRRHLAPPQHTALGGEIMIHGGGSARDWTWGCIALENADVEELFARVPVGTPVRIEP